MDALLSEGGGHGVGWTLPDAERSERDSLVKKLLSL